jgi:subtilisin family serine protease
MSQERGLADVVIVLEPAASFLSRAAVGRPSAAAETERSLQAAHEAVLREFFVQVAGAGVTLLDAESFWLAPAVSARVQLEQIPLLHSLPGVASVIEDAPVELLNPARSPAVQSAADATAAGMDLVGVRPLWHQGLTGRGTLVASLDTGVDGFHPALQSRYRGQHATAAESWRDPEGGTYPNDPSGHGTHTMGTVLGCEPGDTVGIAPEAEWIAAGVVDRNRTFSETISDLLAAFQWLADPDGRPETRSDRPDVVLNSWGIPQGILPSCDATFWQVVDHLEALGTVVVFAAGNEGPGSSTLRQPADRGDSYLGCFAVGAVDALAPFAGASPFSSRGPVSCNAAVIKPEIVAPGVSVRSCARGGGYRLLSGTSMAAPYVVGAICLMRQHNPDATPFEIKEALVQSAQDIEPAGPDFATGYGLLNIPAAIARLSAAKPLSLSITVPEATTGAVASTGFVTASGDIRIDNLGRSLEGVSVTVRPRMQSCTNQAAATLYFDYVEAEQGFMVVPLALESTETLRPGDRLWVDLALQMNSPRLDTSITLGVRVGEGPMPSAMTVSYDGLSVVTTNAGRFDTAGAEAVSVHTAEFAYDGVRIPFTGGLTISAQGCEVSSFGDNDFEPVSRDGQGAPSAAALAASSFRDTRHPNPVGMEFDQLVLGGSEGPGAYLIMDYRWRRLWDEGAAAAFGSWFLWQPDGGTTIVATGAQDELCLAGSGVYFGCVWLSRRSVEASYAPYDAGASAQPSPDLPGPTPSDAYWCFFREQAQADASGGFALAFVAGRTLVEWQEAAQRARAQYVTGAADEEVKPLAFELYPSYPNPFNPSTTIRFATTQESAVKVEVFNALGRPVGTLLDAYLPAGTHHLRWEAADGRGVPLPSGLYIVRVTSADEVRTGKMTLLR